MSCVCELTGDEGDLADEHPLVREEELQHDEAAVLAVQPDADVPGVLHHGVRHVAVVHQSVVAELALLVGEVDLRGGTLYISK